MIKKIFAFIGIIFGGICLTGIIGIVWPLPTLTTPKPHEYILIKDINIINVGNGEINARRDVLIKHNRIIGIDSTGQLKYPESQLIINGTGQYLIPGLWDMHTHSSPLSPWLHHPLFIANGVTGIRDMSGNLDRPDSYWSGTADRQKWNKAISNNSHVGPRNVLHSSFQINGSSSVPDDFPEFFKMEKEADVNQLLQFYQNEGADFIKVYSEIPASTYRSLVKRAPEYNLHIAGHKPLNVSLEETILLGQRNFEHGRIFMFDCFPEAESLRIAKNKQQQFAKSMPSMVNHFDKIEARRLMELMRIHNTHWTPTLQTLKMSAFADDPNFVMNPLLKYIPNIRQWLIWNPDTRRASQKNTSPDTNGLNMAFYRASQKQVKMANDLGVPIIAGTDVTDTQVYPGFSLHQELEDLTEAGLSNLTALQATTIVPARYCKLEEDFGSVEVGKLADMVILENNPLKEIGNTRSITGVFHNGLYYDQDKLEELKAITERLSGSFHLNVKFVYNLFRSPLMRQQFAD